jgi:peroxiredoxin
MKRLLLALILTATGLATQADTIAPAPNFTLKSDSGDNIRLSEQRGDVVMLNFWASWCGPCRQEMPHLDELHGKYSALGFTVFGVNVDEDRSMAEKVLADIPVDFPVLFDANNKVSEQYQVDAMPMTVLVDRDGNIRHTHRGYRPGFEDEYELQIRALVRE